MRIARVITWVIAVLLCGIAFVRSGSALLLGIAIAVIVVPLAGWLGAVLAARKVDVSLSSPTTATKGAKIAVLAEFDNASRLPVASACVDVVVRNLLTGEVATLPIAASLPPRSQVTVPVDLSSELCGRVECSVGRVRLFDFFRLFSSAVPCTAERRLTVMPDLHEASLRDVYAASPLSDTTVFSPYMRGSDLSETFGLREYEQGDELKRIHWKLSEKIDKMIVRDASLPLDNALMLFWDKRAAVGAGGETGAGAGAGGAGARDGAGTGAGAGNEAGADPGRGTRDGAGAGAGAGRGKRDGADGVARDVALAADSMAEVVLALMEQLARAGIAFEVASNDIPASRCTRTFVTDENDIYEVIGQLLSAPVAPAAESGLAEYIRFYGDLTCSRLLYICHERPYNLENLVGAREAVLLVCDGGSDMAARGQVAEIHFPPGGARIALDMLGVM